MNVDHVLSAETLHGLLTTVTVSLLWCLARLGLECRDGRVAVPRTSLASAQTIRRSPPTPTNTNSWTAVVSFKVCSIRMHHKIPHSRRYRTQFFKYLAKRTEKPFLMHIAFSLRGGGVKPKLQSLLIWRWLFFAGVKNNKRRSPLYNHSADKCTTLSDNRLRRARHALTGMARTSSLLQKWARSKPPLAIGEGRWPAQGTHKRKKNKDRSKDARVLTEYRGKRESCREGQLTGWPQADETSLTE